MHMLLRSEMMRVWVYSKGFSGMLYWCNFHVIFFVDRVIVEHSHTSFDETDANIMQVESLTIVELEDTDRSDKTENSEKVETHTVHHLNEVHELHTKEENETKEISTPNSTSPLSKENKSDQNSSESSEVEMPEDVQTTRKNKGKNVGHSISNYMNVIVLITALSIHSLFEGLGLGASNDPLLIFIAIVAHKWADSGLAVLYLMQKIRRWVVCVIILFIFSLFTPIGALIGSYIIASLEDEKQSCLVQGIMCCIAAGSFLFVSIVEILGEAFEEHHHNEYDSHTHHGGKEECSKCEDEAGKGDIKSKEHRDFVIDKYIKFGLAF
ncbi:zinc-iron transporter, putative, partial [Entamoeba invadens IP1]